MVDEDLTVSPNVGDLDPEDVTLEAELNDEDAEREIDKAVRGRRRVARRYVKRIRSQNPDATPAETIGMLERRYVTAITAAGAAVMVGTIAAEVGLAIFNPGAAAAAAGAKVAAKQAGKKAAKEAGKKAAKAAALGAAKSGFRRLLPAGAEQLQFEITAFFALALADIHGMDLDQEQGLTLVYGLSNDRMSQKQIATMASDLARSTDPDAVGTDQATAGEGKDLEHWASILADSLPGGAAQSLVRGLQTGVLENIRGLDGKKQAAVEYGVGALAGGITRFTFGREVVKASHSAFPAAPDTFPAYLDVPVTPEDGDDEPNRALEAFENAAKAIGSGVSTRAAAVGTGVASAAGAAARPFRSVDLDGDGVPDEPQALTAVKGIGGAIAGAAGSLDGGVSGLFKSRKRGKHAVGGPQGELEELEEGSHEDVTKE